jgi:calcineurin-like phosphoesterase family protein
MSYTYLSADWHLSHENIIKYKPVRLNEVVEYYKKIQRDIVEEKLKLKFKR